MQQIGHLIFARAHTDSLENISRFNVLGLNRSFSEDGASGIHDGTGDRSPTDLTALAEHQRGNYQGKTDQKFRGTHTPVVYTRHALACL
jgi:hypothetical protein